MRIIPVSVLAALFIVTQIFANVSVGLKGGVGLSTWHGAREWANTKPYEDQVVKYGFTGGLIIGIEINPHLAFRSEYLYVQKGRRIESKDSTVDRSIDYLEIPLFLEAGMPLGRFKVNMFAGPAFAFKISTDLEYEGVESTVNEDELKEAFDNGTNMLDVGVVVGLGCGIGAGPGSILIETRYTLGLLKIFKLTDEEEIEGRRFDYDLPQDKNSTLSLMVGYSIEL